MRKVIRRLKTNKQVAKMGQEQYEQFCKERNKAKRIRQGRK